MAHEAAPGPTEMVCCFCETPKTRNKHTRETQSKLMRADSNQLWSGPSPCFPAPTPAVHALLARRRMCVWRCATLGRTGTSATGSGTSSPSSAPSAAAAGRRSRLGQHVRCGVSWCGVSWCGVRCSGATLAQHVPRNMQHMPSSMQHAVRSTLSPLQAYAAPLFFSDFQLSSPT